MDWHRNAWTSGLHPGVLSKASKTSEMGFFSKNSTRLNVFNYFRKKLRLKVALCDLKLRLKLPWSCVLKLHWVLYTPLIPLKIILQQISVAFGASTIISEYAHRIFFTNTYMTGLLLKLNLLLDREKIR